MHKPGRFRVGSILEHGIRVGNDKRTQNDSRRFQNLGSFVCNGHNSEWKSQLVSGNFWETFDRTPNKQDNYGNMEAIMMIPEAPIHKMKKDATLM